jgi:hypothetical protein
VLQKFDASLCGTRRVRHDIKRSRHLTVDWTITGEVHANPVAELPFPFMGSSWPNLASGRKAMMIERDPIVAECRKAGFWTVYSIGSPCLRIFSRWRAFCAQSAHAFKSWRRSSEGTSS